MLKLALFTLFLSWNAQATEVAPCQKNQECYMAGSNFTAVADSELKLLGRGITGRKKNQVLAVACIGEEEGSLEKNCSLLRFVYFVNPAEVYLIGPSFKTNLINKHGKAVPENVVLKKALKTLEKRADFGHHRAIAGVALGVGFSATGIIAVLTGTYGIFGVYMGFIFAGAASQHIMEFLDPMRPIKNCIVGADIVQVMSKDGWNWSAHPRKVRESLLQNMIHEIMLPQGFIEHNQEFVSPVN